MIGQHKRVEGFTIVELLIVVVVIAILATITIISYNGIQSRARASLVQSALREAVQQMELEKIDTSVYGTTFPSSFGIQPGIILSLSENGNNFCANAESTTGAANLWYYDSATGTTQQGTCPGAVLAGSELGAFPNLIEDTTFLTLGTGTDQWGATVGGATSIAGTARAGVSTDPYPNRRVLRIVNSAAQATATYAYVKGPVNEAAITSGTTYTASYYVRLASGTHAASLTHFAVMNGSALNSSIPYVAGAGVPNGTWQKITRTVNASQNGVAGTFLYLGVGLNDVKTAAFALEFQGFELRRV
ncbi:MAG: prepilin-type N-terminal cleavage/methylation domain-containing protein [Patescibacteria group bacterium]